MFSNRSPSKVRLLSPDDVELLEKEEKSANVRKEFDASIKTDIFYATLYYWRALFLTETPDNDQQTPVNVFTVHSEQLETNFRTHYLQLKNDPHYGKDRLYELLGELSKVNVHPDRIALYSADEKAENGNTQPKNGEQMKAYEELISDIVKAFHDAFATKALKPTQATRKLTL